VNLFDYETGEYLRPATPEELHESIEAAKHDGGAGVITVDGRRSYACGAYRAVGRAPEPGTDSKG
jgi:hypothetical protein